MAISGGLPVSAASAEEAAPTAPDLIASPQVPNPSVFVGRAREIKRMLAGLESARSGRGELFLLVGEPGIGKTRLAEEMARAASRQGAAVLWARFSDDGSTAAFAPWQQVLRAAIELAGAEQAIARLSEADCAHIAKLAPRLLQFRSAAAPIAEAAGNERTELFDAVTALLRALATPRPLLLVLDDVHTADPLSSLLLHHLAGQLRDTGIAVIASYRPVEGAAALVEIMRVGHYLPLAGLSSPETGNLIQQAFGIVPENSLLTMVHKLTGGNPFFIDGIATVLASQGRLGESWDAGGPNPELPAEMRRTVLTRLRPLPEAARALLRTAAVVGSEFDAELLRIVEGLSEQRLYKLIHKLVGAHLLSAVPAHAGRYRFAHVLIRDAVYGELPALERARSHAVVAQAMEQLYADRIDQQLDAIAHHYSEGSSVGGAAQALEYLQRAAQQAMANYAYEAAAAYAQRALELRDVAGSLAEQTRAQLYLLLGHAQMRSGKRLAANAAFMQTALIARKLDRPELLAQAALGQASGIGGLVDAEPDFAAIAMLEESLVRLPADEQRLRVRCKARLSVELYRAADLVRSQRLAREAVDSSRDLQEPALRLAALLALAWTLVGPDTLAERSAAASECLRLARDLGDRETEFHARHVTIETLLVEGKGEAVDAQILICDRIAQALRQVPLAWQVGVFRTMRALMAGHIAEARRLSQETHAIGQDAIGALAAHNFHTEQFDIVWADGFLEEMVEPFRRAAEQSPNASAWIPGLILACIAAERREEARILFDRMLLQGLDRIPRDALWVSTMSLLGEACARLHDKKAARELLKLLRPWAPGAVIVLAGRHCMGSSSRILGLLTATLERWDEAMRHFEAALSFESRLGAFRWHAYTSCDQAEVLLSRAADGDHERAVMLLRRAAQTAGELGVGAIVRRATALLEQAEPQNRLLSDVASLLTDRRQRIVKLAARGLSNKDIARELGVGERTIKDHWSVILARLGARNRGQAIGVILRYAEAAGLDLELDAPQDAQDR